MKGEATGAARPASHEHVQAEVHGGRGDEIGIRCIGDGSGVSGAAGGEVVWLPLPLAYGVIRDPTAIGDAAVHDQGKTWSSVYGGVKLAPTVSRSDAARTPSRLVCSPGAAAAGTGMAVYMPSQLRASWTCKAVVPPVDVHQ